MIKPVASASNNRHRRRFLNSILTCLILLTTCAFLIVLMVNLLADGGHNAIKLDRMAQRKYTTATGRPILRAKGIHNGGNICFASSVAQMLYRIDGIYEFVAGADVDGVNLSGQDKRTLQGLKSLFKALDDPRSSSVRGHANAFIPVQFPPREMGDSEEFYTAWVGLLERAMGQDRLRAELFLKVVLNRTLGTNETRISTDDWSTIRVTFPENAIAQNRPVALDDLLGHPQGPFGEDILNEQLRQTYRIANGLPKTLVLSLVRTAYNPKKGLVKINTPVEIPQVLNLAPFMATPFNTTAQNQFKLKMFVLHEGNKAEGGHYVAYVQDDQERWQIIDDERIHGVSKEKAIQSVKLASLCFFDKL